MPAHRVPTDPGENAAADPGRRRALKLGAALGAGTIVWAEPTIKGLASRPAYAAAGSSALTLTFDAVGLALIPGTAVTHVPTGALLTLSIADLAPSVTVSLAGCSCTIVSRDATLTLRAPNPDPAQPDISIPINAMALAPTALIFQSSPSLDGAASLANGSFTIDCVPA